MITAARDASEVSLAWEQVIKTPRKLGQIIVEKRLTTKPIHLEVDFLSYSNPFSHTMN